jgi:hypothetical protein
MPGTKKIFEQKREMFLKRRPSTRGMRDLDKFRELLLQKLLLKETKEPLEGYEYKELLSECESYANEALGRGFKASLEAAERIYQKLRENFDITQPIRKLPGLPGRGCHHGGAGGSCATGGGSSKDQQDQGRLRIPPPNYSNENCGCCDGNVGKPDDNKRDKDNKGNGGKPSDNDTDKGNKGKAKPKNKSDDDKSGGSENDKGDYSRVSSGDTSADFDAIECGIELIELEPGESDTGWIKSTLRKYDAEIQKTKMILRDIDSRINRKRLYEEGDEIDIEEYIQNELERKANNGSSDNRFFIKPVKRKRVAWAVLADITESTKEDHIIDDIKDAVLVQGEALNGLDYPYALYAFNSDDRDIVYVIKNFDQRYDDKVRRKIQSLSPDGYTKMSDAIRYVARKLSRHRKDVNVLTVITDGESQYQSDCRKALGEAFEKDVYPFLIVIGKEHEEYAESLTKNYLVIEDAKDLPKELLHLLSKYGMCR